MDQINYDLLSLVRASYIKYHHKYACTHSRLYCNRKKGSVRQQAVFCWTSNSSL